MANTTKAKKYLVSRGSKLQHQASFGLMYNSAKAAYSEIRMKIQNRREDYPGELGSAETYALLDFAVLSYLKKHNNLPPNISTVFFGQPSLEELKSLAMGWLAS